MSVYLQIAVRQIVVLQTVLAPFLTLACIDLKLGANPIKPFTAVIYGFL